MKRLLASLLGGVLFPFLYAAVFGPLSTYIQNRWLNKLVGVPVRWPILILEYLSPAGLDIISLEGQDKWLLLYILVCDVVLYSTITYVLLVRFWKRKSSPVASPPQPPQFEAS